MVLACTALLVLFCSVSYFVSQSPCLQLFSTNQHGSIKALPKWEAAVNRDTETRISIYPDRLIKPSGSVSLAVSKHRLDFPVTLLCPDALRLFMLICFFAKFLIPNFSIVKLRLLQTDSLIAALNPYSQSCGLGCCFHANCP